MIAKELKVKIIRACIIEGQDATPGEIWSVSRTNAAILVGDGLAILLDAKQNYTVTVEVPEHGDPRARKVSAAPPVVTEKATAKA